MDRGGSKSSRRLVNASETEQSLDRLSDLPESMLCHILSFLTIKESVATSILARPWRYLWTNFSTLKFDASMCENLLDRQFDDILLKCNIRRGNSHGRFDIAYARNRGSDVVNRLLLMQNIQVLNTFNLHYHLLDFTDSQIDSWITIAIARGVKNIDICCWSWEWDSLTDACSNKLPVSLFRCETLVDLRLRGCFMYIPPNGKVSMSSLKKLFIERMIHGDDETLPRLLSGCPILEKLVIDQEKFEWLVVKYLPTLIEAEIGLSKDDTYACSWPVDILNGFSNAKSLSVSYRYGEFSDSKFEALTSKFPNLIEFYYMCSDCRLLVKFLEKADNLKQLIVHQIKSRHWQDPPQVFDCLSSHLETVFVHRVSADDHTFRLVRYLLKNAKVLKNMTVGIPNHLPTIDQENLKDRISSLERGSPQCRIEFDEYDTFYFEDQSD